MSLGLLGPGIISYTVSTPSAGSLTRGACPALRRAKRNSSLGHAYTKHLASIDWGLCGHCLRPACRSAGALQLITASEAALPVDQSRERGISRGPTVVIVSPSPAAGTIKSPPVLKVRFESLGAAKIDVDSVLITYMKKPAVDLTQRIKPFVEATGIDVENAEVPPGTHTLRVNVTDTEGRSGWADLTFSVSK